MEAALLSGQGVDEDGVEEAFELVTEVSERVRTAIWVGDCFVYNNSAWRLNYCVGGEVSGTNHSAELRLGCCCFYVQQQRITAELPRLKGRREAYK